MTPKIACLFAGFALIAVLTVTQISDSHRNHHPRNKRSVVEQYSEDEIVYTGESPVIDIDDAVFLGFASLVDHAGCGARLVCEVHTLSEEELDMTGQRLTDLFR